MKKLKLNIEQVKSLGTIVNIYINTNQSDIRLEDDKLNSSVYDLNVDIKFTNPSDSSKVLDSLLNKHSEYYSLNNINIEVSSYEDILYLKENSTNLDINSFSNYEGNAEDNNLKIAINLKNNIKNLKFINNERNILLVIHNNGRILLLHLTDRQTHLYRMEEIVIRYLNSLNKYYSFLDSLPNIIMYKIVKGKCESVSSDSLILEKKRPFRQYSALIWKDISCWSPEQLIKSIINNLSETEIYNMYSEWCFENKK